MIVASGGSSIVAAIAPAASAVRLDGAAIALARAAIVGGVGVEDLAPCPAFGSGTR